MFILAGLAVALVCGVVLSNVASPKPDGLESAVLKTHCADADDPAACLDELSGDAVGVAVLPDYEIPWLSGLVGVLACFALGAGGVGLLRRARRRSHPRVVP
jgi:cobalt/nickel transport protein